MAHRVLLVNKYYYPRGGDCVVMMGTEALLRDNGVEAEAFAMDYPDNVKARYQALFAPEVSFDGSIGNQLRAFKRTMGAGDVKDRFVAVLDEFKPDVVHLHNIHSYLSPVVGKIAHQRGIRVVWTMHDYKLLCPRYDCLCDGQPCEHCFSQPHGLKTAVIRRRCMKGSLPASVVAWLEALRWNRAALERHTDVFVCPSRFMADKMLQAGFNADKIKVLNNFIDPAKLNRCQSMLDEGSRTREDYYCYVGRLSHEKGVARLLIEAEKLPYRIKVAGTGPLEDELKKRFGGRSNIEFLGQLDAQGVADLLSHATMSVVPSQWYENNPLSIIEALCAGTPVVGTDIGGIPELIDEGRNGLICPSADHLMTTIHDAMSRQWDHDAIARDALQRFSPRAHLNTLINEIYTP